MTALCLQRKPLRRQRATRPRRPRQQPPLAPSSTVRWLNSPQHTPPLNRHREYNGQEVCAQGSTTTTRCSPGSCHAHAFLPRPATHARLDPGSNNHIAGSSDCHSGSSGPACVCARTSPVPTCAYSRSPSCNFSLASSHGRTTSDACAIWPGRSINSKCNTS